MAVPHRTPGRPRRSAPPPDSATGLVRWAAFSCVLVPVVLLWCGTSLAGAAVTAGCRLLLRRSERGPARPPAGARAPHRGRRHGAGPGPHRGGRHTEGNTPVG
ncbi:hypothetical protein [Streptomyces sp. NPDC020996]|uniref:hypothetical protein n=1 Tax=Streptomyces sp. NPDC020996 TaxID=3154791 RepID=UPI0033C36B76